MKKKKKGFTLVELVIVIAVIAILAAVLIPTFSAVIKNANNSADLQLVNNLNIVASTHSVSGTGYEFETADNIHKMLAEEGINTLTTKNKDVVIVYNTETQKFERYTLGTNDGKTTLVAFAAESDEEDLETYVGYYLEELFVDKVEENFEYKRIVSTGGNDLVETLYALHNLEYNVTGSYIDDQFKKIKNNDLKEKTQYIMQDTVFITNKGSNGEDEKAVSISFDNSGKAIVSDNIVGKKRIIFHEHYQELNLDILGDAKDTLIAIIPNYITAVYGDAGNMYLSGNTNALSEQIKENYKDNIITVEWARYLVRTNDKENLTKQTMDNLSLTLGEFGGARVTWTDFQNKLVEEIAVAFEVETKSVDIISMDDGNYYYGSAVEGCISGGTYVNGGTYKLVATANDNDIYGSGKGNQPLIVKFQTVQIATGISYNENAIWFTIEEALALASTTKDGVTYGTTVVVAGSTTTGADSTAVVTAFTALSDSVTKYDEASRTIKSGVALLLPYDGVSGDYEAQSSIYVADMFDNGNGATNPNYRKAELIVPNSKIIINEGTITVGGVTYGGMAAYRGGGATSGRYAQITLGKNAKIESFGNINSYGFIIEEMQDNGSSVNMRRATLRMPLFINEHRGGTNMGLMKGTPKGSPFNRYYMQNVTPKLTVKYDSSVVGIADMYIGSAAVHVGSDVNFIGSSSNYFFQLVEESGYITWKYSINEAKVDGVDMGARTIKIDTYGNITINSLSLTISEVSISTSNAAMPLPWQYSLTFHPGENGEATVDSMKQDIKILPGAKVKVEKYVTLNIGQLIVYDSTFDDPALANASDGGTLKYPTDKGNGHLIINGILKATNLGGYVKSEVDGAKLSTTKNTATAYEPKSVTLKIILNWLEVKKTLTGDTANGNNQTLSAGSYMSQGGKWIKA